MNAPDRISNFVYFFRHEISIVSLGAIKKQKNQRRIDDAAETSSPKNFTILFLLVSALYPLFAHSISTFSIHDDAKSLLLLFYSPSYSSRCLRSLPVYRVFEGQWIFLYFACFFFRFQKHSKSQWKMGRQDKLENTKH